MSSVYGKLDIYNVVTALRKCEYTSDYIFVSSREPISTMLADIVVLRYVIEMRFWIQIWYTAYS
jgi:hypothetical protein